MSNYEERFEDSVSIPHPTPLDKWNAAKEDTLSLLSQARSILNSAAISAKNMRGTIYSQECDSINMDIVAPFAERIRNTRAPHYIVDASNEQLEREKNDRLRRAREQFINNPTITGWRKKRNETKAWGKLSSVAIALTENNNTGTRSTSAVAGQQIYLASAAENPSFLDYRLCSCRHIFYSRDSIGDGCINCGKPLSSF